MRKEHSGIFLLLTGLFIGWISTETFSQYYETQITQVIDEHGIAPGATFAVAEDQLGFIWFGTTDGLYRYDGNNLKIYRNIPENPHSLSNNTIRGLAFDKEGLLWIATQGGGLDCFDLFTETFTHYHHTGNSDNEISGNSLWAVMVDHRDNIWVGVTGKGIDRLERETGLFRFYNPLPDGDKLRQEQTVRSLVESPSGLIWAGIPEHGLVSLNPSTGHIDQEDGSTIKGIGLSDLTVYDMLHMNTDKLFIATYGGGVNIYDTGLKTYSYLRQKDFVLSSDLAYTLAGNADEVWIGTEYGINHLDLGTGENYTYKKSGKVGNELSENRIRKLFIDSKGIVWAGSESGVDKIVKRENFMVYRNFPGEKNTMPEGIVRAILLDEEDNLWIGLVENGLVKYSRKDKQYTHYQHDPEIPYSLPGNNINALYMDKEGILWIGEWGLGLMRYDPKTDRFEKIADKLRKEQRSFNSRIQVITEKEPGILWIGTEIGILRYDIKNNSLSHFRHEEDDPNSLSGNAIQSQAFRFDKEDNLWAGTWSFGLNKIEFLNPEESRFRITNWKNDPDNAGSLNNDNVISLFEDKEGILWVGTFGGGLNRLDQQTNTFKAYTTEEGLPNNIVFAIIGDEDGRLWLSTDNGISVFDPKKETFRNYNRSDGLQDNHFFWGAAWHSRHGEVFLGGINGVNSFFPEQIRPDTSLAIPVIVEIRLFNDIVQFEKPTFRLKEAVFNYDQNFLTFEFAALNFSKPEQNQYKYILEGFEKEWIYPKHNHTATYTNLSPGRYTFKLMVSNSYGMWNEDPCSIGIVINPPWWRTWWMMSLFLISGIFIAYSIINIRFRILQKQKYNLEQEVKARTSEVVKKNVLLERQTAEIQDRNVQLNEQKKELAAKNQKLKQTLATLEQTQLALLNSEKMASLGVLTAGVAHEINNPLNFIAVSIDNLKTELEEIDFPKATETDIETLNIIEELLQHAENGVERILKITNRLKNYVQKGEEAEDIFDVNEMITASLQLLHSKIPAHIRIKKELKEVPKVAGHRYQISQVIINIIDNALDAIAEKESGESESITLHTGEESIDGIPYVLIRITNTGPPIPEKLLKNIFDPFFTTKAPNKGTGLGLYLSYNIIKEHKGLFSVANRNKKVNFKIHLPVHDQ